LKKALVVAMLMVLGLGVWAAAASPFTGSWTTTIGIDVSAASFTDFFTKFDSSLAVDYTIGGWVFGSKSTFKLTGFSSQSFTATGVLGAFSFSSTMAFSPMQVTKWSYPAVQTDSIKCDDWKATPATYGPAFLTWDATGSVSIAGVSIEGLFFLDQSNTSVTKEDYLFLADWTQTDSVTAASAANGSGFRLTISGSAGGMTFTSRTYFNLYEYTNALLNAIYGLPACPTIGMSGVYEINSEGCDVGFNREYITVEGFSFGCATIDLALDISCSGFGSLTALVQDVQIGNWLDLDFSIAFTTSSKTFSSCLSFTGMTTDCYTIEIGSATGGTIVGNTIGDVTIHGVGLSYEWDGITFASYTELTKYSALFSSSTKWTYLNGHDTEGFLVPYVGLKTLAVDATCSAFCTPETYWAYGDAYTLKCVPLERFRLWEEFKISSSADACCGGAFAFSIDTYFGQAEKLLWYGYAFAAAGGTSYATPVTLYGSTGDAPTFSSLSSNAKNTGVVSTHAVYQDDSSLTTLFGWAKSKVSVSLGIGSNFTITVGGAIDAFGWESLDFGFTASF